LQRTQSELKSISDEKNTLQFLVEFVYSAKCEWNPESHLPLTTEKLFSLLSDMNEGSFGEREYHVFGQILKAIDMTLQRTKSDLLEMVFWLSTSSSLLEVMQKHAKFQFVAQVYDLKFISDFLWKKEDHPPPSGPLWCEGKLQHIMTDSMQYLLTICCKQTLRVCMEAFLMENPAVFSVEKSREMQSKKAVDPISDLVEQFDRIVKQLQRGYLHSMLTTWILENLFQFINAFIFNEIMNRSELCSVEVGFNIKLVISFIKSWAASKEGVRLDDGNLYDLVSESFCTLIQIVDALVILPNGSKEFSSVNDFRLTFPSLKLCQIYRIVSQFTTTRKSKEKIPPSIVKIVKKGFDSLPESEKDAFLPSLNLVQI